MDFRDVFINTLTFIFFLRESRFLNNASMYVSIRIHKNIGKWKNNAGGTSCTNILDIQNRRLDVILHCSYKTVVII